MENTLKQILLELQNLNQKYDNLERRFDGLEQRFNGLERRFDGLEKRFDIQEKRLNNLEKRVESLDEKVESHGELLHQLINIVGNTNSHLEELVERNSILEEKQIDHEKILETLSLRSLKQEAEISAIKKII